MGLGRRAVYRAISLKIFDIILIATFCFFWLSSTCGPVLPTSPIKVYISLILLFVQLCAPSGACLRFSANCRISWQSFCFCIEPWYIFSVHGQVLPTASPTGHVQTERDLWPWR